MTIHAHYFAKSIFVITCLTIGCTGSGMAGCGSADEGAKVDSQLLGVYAIDSYQSSPVDPQTGDPIPDSCDQLSDTTLGNDFLVLYSFKPDANPDEPLLVGAFCPNVAACEQVAREARAPALGYSFIEGDDQSGWVGFGISSVGSLGDQCLASVQTHTLSSAGPGITINTDTVETTFKPTLDGDVATCSNRDAISAITPDLPCKARLLLEATRE